MNPSMTLDFDSAGVGHCLYGEAIDLQTIGPLEVRRASQIEFNPETQRWEVIPPNGGAPLFTSMLRSRCEAWERTHLHPVS